MFDLVIAQSAHSVEASVIERLDGDVLSAAIILAVIGSVAIVITLLVVVSNTIQNLVATRMAYKMIRELSKQGYTAQEVEKLVYGDKTFARRVRRMFSRAKGRVGNRWFGSSQPAPPVKSA